MVTFLPRKLTIFLIKFSLQRSQQLAISTLIEDTFLISAPIASQELDRPSIDLMAVI
jgi:hypothetical protein